MKHQFIGKLICCGMACAFLLAGCAGSGKDEKSRGQKTGEEVFPTETTAGEEAAEMNTAEPDPIKTDPEKVDLTEPKIVEADWSSYFDGLNGTAVLYDVSRRQFTIYNRELASVRRSPCSTFKIISSLVALEHGIVEPGNSTRKWSGEVFWNEAWNGDMDFAGAFRESCVWYFREVIDEIGQKRMQQELDRLAYGNCDISDWEGRFNTNNNNRALTGFWLESSLAVSPKEQTEVLERIFGADSVYSDETLSTLKEVMLVEEQEKTDSLIYGKTGMGKAEGVVVDAWFTGFAECTDGPVYFCVYIGRTDDKNVTSAAAKEIAIRLVSDYAWH